MHVLCSDRNGRASQIHNFSNIIYPLLYCCCATLISSGVVNLEGNQRYLNIFKLKTHCLAWHLFEPAFISVQSAFGGGETGKESQCCGSFFRPYSLDHTKSPFWRRHFMCCAAGGAGKKDLLCLFRTVLDDVHALTGRDWIYCSWEILSGRS